MRRLWRAVLLIIGLVVTTFSVMAFISQNVAAETFNPDDFDLDGWEVNSNTFPFDPLSTFDVKIEFETDGGSGGPKSLSALYGSTITLPLDKPVRDGDIFMGWANQPQSDIIEHMPGDSFQVLPYTEDGVPEDSITLYAVWKAKTYCLEYIIDVDVDPISVGNLLKEKNGMLSENVKFGKIIDLPNTELIRKGYDFLGWSYDAKTVKYKPGDCFVLSSLTFFPSDESDDCMKLYPVWSPKSYIIKYNGNGGFGSPSNQGVTYGELTYLSKTEPVRAGYSFLGWSVDSNATTATYNAGDGITIETDNDITLYAVWNKNATDTSAEEAAKKAAEEAAKKAEEEARRAAEEAAKATTEDTQSSNTKTYADISAPSKVKHSYGEKSFQLQCASYSGTSLFYETSDSSVVTVSNTGMVTIKGCGNATITVISPETGKYKEAYRSINVTIVPDNMSGLKVSSKSKNKILITWKKTDTKKSIEIQISKNDGFDKKATSTITKKLNKLKRGRITVTIKKNNKVRYVRIRTVATKSGKKYYSEWSSVKRVKIK